MVAKRTGAPDVLPMKRISRRSADHGSAERARHDVVHLGDDRTRRESAGDAMTVHHAADKTGLLVPENADDAFTQTLEAHPGKTFSSEAEWKKPRPQPHCLELLADQTIERIGRDHLVPDLREMKFVD